MNRKTRTVKLLFVAALLCAPLTHHAAADTPLGTAFTYQGRMLSGGTPANGSYDLTFSLFNSESGDTKIGTTLTRNEVNVKNGLFTASLDFGKAFTGSASWLEITAKTGVSGPATLPRQQMTPAPNALFATRAGTLGDSNGNVTVPGTVKAAAFEGTETTEITVKDQSTNLKLDTNSHIVVGHSGSRSRAWQTFTSGQTGNLNSLSIHYTTLDPNNPISALFSYRLSIRAGEPAAGSADSLAPLGVEQQMEHIPIPGEKRTFSFAGVKVTAGQKYTIYIRDIVGTDDVNSKLDVGLAAAPYAGGKSNFPSELDWYFETVVSNVESPLMKVAGQLSVNGEATVNALNIVGGSDIAEPFDISAADVVKPGMVVSIDPGQPGALRLSTGAYDRTVAGIVSGAGGVNTGLTLTQTGTAASGKHPVALTGRVYCYVDASDGDPIQPGDLLTTSDTPGHAMKVKDPAKSQGAIIGKAMSPLAGGQGLVLVLVSLQ